MNEMNTKLDRIRRSSHTGKIVARILFVLCIVGCIASIIAGIGIISKKAELEPEITRYQDEGRVDLEHITISNFDLGTAGNWHSDVPAIQSFIDEYPLVFALSTYMWIVAGATLIAGILTKLLELTFAAIETEETPFNDKVIKKVLIVMIVISALLLTTMGAAWGILSALATWVIYNIMDYGKTLQIQSDETL